MALHTLIIEADTVLREVLGELMESWGYEVALAANEDEAAAMLQADPLIRVALVEDNMRLGIDGVDIVLQSKTVWPNIHWFIYAVDQQDALQRAGLDVDTQRVFSKGETEGLKKELKALDQVLNSCSAV